MTKIEVFTVAAVATGVIWMCVAGSLWQFLPIGAAIFVARLAAKALEDKKPASEPKAPKPAKGKSK